MDWSIKMWYERAFPSSSEAEQRAVNASVGGSIPSWGDVFGVRYESVDIG